VEEAMEQGESCLIHSLHGKSRACAVLGAYLMRKYSWSLNKSLELINAKKEGLEVRSNYLVQMQELEGRLAETAKLSYSWAEAKNEEDELLANTFANSKKAGKVEGNHPKRQNMRKVTWDEKPAQKFAVTAPNSMAITLNRFGKTDKREGLKVRSILKGFPSEEEAGRVEAREKMNENGSLVAVTVNNFMQSDKKQEQPQTYNNRPYSSDNKERKPTPYELKPNRLFAYDNPVASNIKTAYDNKIIGKIGVTTAGISKNPKRPEEVRKGVLANDRPQSANIVPDRKKPRSGYPYSWEEMVVTNNLGKKRYPSTNARDEVIRLK
jgi:hypothetical protein